jgi:DNA-binding Lrp family transcriptional regulator
MMLRGTAMPRIVARVVARVMARVMARFWRYSRAMDDTDRALIALLRKDARASIATLAAKLKVSRGTVTNRLRKLEDRQVIVGYSVRLKPEAEPDLIRAWMGVLVEGNQTRAVIASLLGEPGVEALHDTNGRWDLLAELRAQSMAELSQVLERIRLVKGIANTETNILLTTYR